MQNIFTTLLVIFFCLNVHAETNLYKKVRDGVSSFSDRPTAQSELIIIDNKKNLISTEILTIQENSLTEIVKANYKNYIVQILGINNEQTFRNIKNLKINVRVSPSFQYDTGQKLRLMFNKKALQPLQINGSIFEVSNIERGEHKLQAQIIDYEGRLLGKSDDLTIFVHKHSILQ